MQSNQPKADFYIFGSALTDSEPNDIDVLAVYTRENCAPEAAFDRFNMFLSSLPMFVGKKLHLTPLTQYEEREFDFIRRARAVRLCIEASKLNGQAIH